MQCSVVLYRVVSCILVLEDVSEEVYPSLTQLNTVYPRQHLG